MGALNVDRLLGFDYKIGEIIWVKAWGLVGWSKATIVGYNYTESKKDYSIKCIIVDHPQPWLKNRKYYVGPGYYKRTPPGRRRSYK